ncbi:MAG: glycine cleavage system aminomethyltransferase GcvT [Nitrospinae bacterium]|nr:glycine cleavage system aminomethyltransferase GcvT [Nitrospinota bacterium]
MTSNAPKKTPLYDRHAAAGAKMVDFAGWLMPVQYEGVLAEHSAVRNRAGLFDVSHMGEIFITGEDAEKFVDHIITNDVRRISDGQILYTVMCDDEGRVLDDLMVYRTSAQSFLLVVNASNTEKDFNWVKSRAGGWRAVVADRSADFGMLALQGPRAVAVASKVLTFPETFNHHAFFEAEYEGARAVVSRTGYTGEDGVEIIVENKAVVRLWDALLEAGKEEGVAPTGLAARDLLRIEAGYSLYGHELDENTDPVSAGLSWVVKPEGREFIGKKALQGVKPTRKRISFVAEGRGIPRQGCKLFVDEKEAGAVTSGTFSPSLQKPVGIGYISAEEWSVSKGGRLTVEIRGRRTPVKVYRPHLKPTNGG